MIPTPPPAIIERVRDQCIRSLPFWDLKAQQEGVWVKDEETIDKRRYWLLSARCGVVNRQPQMMTQVYWSIQSHPENPGLEHQDKLPKFVTTTLITGALSYLFLRHAFP